MRRGATATVCVVAFVLLIAVVAGCSPASDSSSGLVVEPQSTPQTDSAQPSAQSPQARAVRLSKYGPHGRWRLIVVSATDRGDVLVVRVKADPSEPEKRAIKVAAEAAREDLGLAIERVSILYDETGYMAGYFPLD